MAVIKSEPVKFGTDGWRAVIGDTYTFDNVRRVSLATAKSLNTHPKIKNGIVIGYDTRFLSKEFAYASAEIFASEGIKTYITDTFVSTPTVSLLARDKNLAFGVMITASHNPYKYNGFKLKDEFGGSMNPEILNGIELNLGSIGIVSDYGNFGDLLNDGRIEFIAGKDYYVNNLKKSIDIDAIKKSKLKVLYETMYGAGQNTLNEILDIDQLHNEVNPSFGGGAPEPVEKNLALACQAVKDNGFDICIVTDGDADRIAIIDDKGRFLDAQKTFFLLLKYLHQFKKYTGKVVRGFAVTELFNDYCKKHNLELVTVPVGFKYISKIMIEEDVLIGGEESGGIGIKNHLPERDGIFNGLLYLEMLSNTGKKLSDLAAEIDEEFGKYFYKRLDVHTTEEKKSGAFELAGKIKAGDLISGRKVLSVDPLDGFKYYFEGGWITFRASGTEPLIRIYCEVKGKDETEELLKNAVKQFNL